MKIYFSAAIAQKQQYGKYYQRIVETLKRWDHQVFQDTTVVSFNEAVSKSDEERMEYYKKVLSWISQSDLVVLEVSFPSTLHIGHEVSLAIEKGKPVVALYFEDKEPSFFLGFNHSKVFWGEYTDQTIEEILSDGLDYAKTQTQTRFNLFMSSHQMEHLDEMAKKFKIPKTGYVRKLITEDILRKNADSAL